MRENAMLIAIAGLVGLASPLAANEADKETSSNKDHEEITCKYTKVLGSRITEKICMTNFEWEERRRVQMENKRSSRNNNSSCGAGSC